MSAHSVRYIKRQISKWKRLHTSRSAKLRVAIATKNQPRIAKFTSLRASASRNLGHWRKELKAASGSRPTVITARSLGLTFQNVFGGVGTLTRTYGHYTAGPRARTKAEGIRIARGVHNQHKRQGWGGCSYAVIICDDGTIILMNPVARKAAGVAGHNTGSLHINCPGTTGHSPTAAQEASLKWYVANAHTRKVPSAHRVPRRLKSLNGRVHSDDNSTACPGNFVPMYRRVL